MLNLNANQLCYKMYWSKVCVLESYLVSGQAGLDIQLKQSKNANLVRQKISCRWRNTTSQIPFFSVQLIRTYGLVVKVGRRKLGDMGSTPDKCWKSLLPLCHFCVALSPSVHWHACFNIAVLSIVFSFLDFVSGDLQDLEYHQRNSAWNTGIENRDLPFFFTLANCIKSFLMPKTYAIQNLSCVLKLETF